MSQQISNLQAYYAGHQWTVEFPVFINATYQQGRYDEHGVDRHGYAADAPFIDPAQQARYHLAKRFGIEPFYRLGEATSALTTTCGVWQFEIDVAEVAFDHL